jgi:D-3-phosphoglycerate dehydrogenase
MSPYGYDPYLSDDIFRTHGVTRVRDLDDLLTQSAVLTIHTPKTGPHLDRAALEKLPRGAILLNAARGGLVDETALSDLLRSGHLIAAGLDVFVQEPPDPTLDLLQNSHVVMTPHLGGSTHEALANVGVMTATGVIEALNGGTPQNIVNVPIPPLETQRFRALDRLAEVVGRIFATTNEPKDGTMILSVGGNIPDTATLWLRHAVLAAVLNQRLDDRVNTVNALLIAEAQGIQLLLDQNLNPTTPPSLALRFEGHPKSMTTAYLAGDYVHLSKIRDISLDLLWPDRALVTQHKDAPGVVGKVGTMVGDYGINIANLHLGRRQEGEEAIMVLALDAEIPQELVDALMQVESMDQVYVFNSIPNG